MNQLGRVPGNIVISTSQEFAAWISCPLMGKERDGVVLSHGWRDSTRIPRYRAVQGCGKVASSAERDVSDLGCSGIDFDEVRVSGTCFQHEIKSKQTGETHPADNFFDGG